MSASWVCRLTMCHSWAQGSLRHAIIEEQGQEGPYLGLSRLQDQPLPCSRLALTRGRWETWIPCLLLLSLSTTWLPLPAPGLPGSAHQLPLNQCSWETPLPLSWEWSW